MYPVKMIKYTYEQIVNHMKTLEKWEYNTFQLSRIDGTLAILDAILFTSHLVQWQVDIEKWCPASQVVGSATFLVLLLVIMARGEADQLADFYRKFTYRSSQMKLLTFFEIGELI